MAKIFRQAGHDVGESDDPQQTLAALVESPVDAVISSYSTTGTGASLRLLDMIRTHSDNSVNGVPFLLISDHPRKRIFCYQAGADAILMRPFDSQDLLDSVTEMISRSREERIDFRRRQVKMLTASNEGPIEGGNALQVVTY